MSESVSTRVAGVGLHPGPLHDKPAKLMALDVGLARIGVALCDPLQLQARPRDTLQRGSRRADFAALATLIQAEAVQAVICGLPYNMDGSEGPQAATTRKWALRFAQAMRTLLGTPLPVIFWDERLSSFSARVHMQDEATAKARVLASTVLGSTELGEDAFAAAAILQSYLEHLRARAGLHHTPDYDSIVLPANGPSSEPTESHV